MHCDFADFEEALFRVLLIINQPQWQLDKVIKVLRLQEKLPQTYVFYNGEETLADGDSYLGVELVLAKQVE